MRLLIIALALLALFYLLTRGSTKGWIAENRWEVGGAVAAGILLLVVTGKLPALAALAAPVAAFGRRLWERGLLSIFPQLRQILGLVRPPVGAAHAHQRREAPNQPMTTKRAAEILGITEDASLAEIRTAHRN